MYLAILWHFHQPIYRNPENREYILPWVNYHSVKNYYQMARLAVESEFPCAFNFVPCLLEQIDEYALGKANDPYQEALELDAEKLSASQVKRLQKFSPEENDRRRLQMSALLSFFSPATEIKQDKDYLLGLQKKIQREIIPLYKKMQKDGQIELTTSPYYHPLLPLIFDITSADEDKRPTLPFKHPEDVEAQLEKGREYFKKTFGGYPLGLWPSEGGISQEVAHSISQLGYSFAVTDENILWKSLKEPTDRNKLYRPYLYENLSLFFRDRELSDLLGFEYQKWEAKAAVADFIIRLEKRKKFCEDSSICVVALDGENPWGSYAQNGVPFLREFFSQLRNRDGIIPIFFKDYLNQYPAKKQIRLVPGTWLGNFSKWTGNPAKNNAWDRLSKARDHCGAIEEIFVAEGSDWFWWYGEKEEPDFNFLFRSYIKKAYEKSGISCQE